MPALEKRLEIRLSTAQRRDLEVLAAARGWPLGVLVRDLLRQAVARELKREPAEQ
jgi:hypothetical protein